MFQYRLNRIIAKTLLVRQFVNLRFLLILPVSNFTKSFAGCGSREQDEPVYYGYGLSILRDQYVCEHLSECEAVPLLSVLAVLISRQVHDLAEFLHQSSVEEDDNSNDLDEPPVDSKSIGGTSHPRSHFPFSAQPVSRHNGILHGLTDAHTDFLFEKFMENVDPLLKLLHPAVLQRVIRPRKGDVLSATETISLHVLKCAIFYITVTSLSDRQCSQYLDQKRATLLPRLQTTTEIAMSDADILTSENMYVLQALVFYLVCCHPR